MTPQITPHCFLWFSETKAEEGQLGQTQELESRKAVPSGEPGPRRPQLRPHTGGLRQPGA